MLEMQSPAFRPNETIPVKYTSDADDLSPPLQWSGMPENTRSLALIVDDPDAPMKEPYVHWVVYNIPVDRANLPENLPHDMKSKTMKGVIQGRNSAKKIGYAGPAPPKGHGVHHYHFHLYALDQPVPAQGPLDKEELQRVIAGHVLDETDLVGTYER